MVNNSTSPASMNTEATIRNMKSPRQSTLNFIRQFASAYMCINDSEQLCHFIAN